MKQRRTSQASATPREVLAHISARGGQRRRHRYFGDARAFAAPVVIATMGQGLVYGLMFSRTGRADWWNMAIADMALCLVPVLAALTLMAFRRHESSIVSAVAITAVYFSFAVSVLSALRIPVSYSGLAACLPIALVVMAYANIRFQRRTRHKVAIARFAGAEAVGEQLPGTASIVPETAEGLDGVDILLIEPRIHHAEAWAPLLARCYLEQIDIVPWSQFLETQLGRVDVGSFEISHIVYSPSQLGYAWCKRYLDIAAVLVTLPLTLVLGALVAAYIFLRDGWPVLFVQHRLGFGGRVFRMYKFRTMFKGWAGGATSADDKRIIPGCKLVRQLRLDELPQLYNILIGQMSLIGPRPVANYVAKASEKADIKFAYRTLVLPGITGWAQVHSGYAATTEEELEKLSYDLYYIKHLSFDLDLQILFKTVRTVLFGQGAR